MSPSVSVSQSVANARRSALIVLAACGFGVIATTSATVRPLASATDSLVTTGVIVLAVGAIAARQIAARSGEAQTRARYLVAAYSFAAALGICGLLFALRTGEALRGIAYVLAGAIFVLPGSRIDGTALKGGSR